MTPAAPAVSSHAAEEAAPDQATRARPDLALTVALALAVGMAMVSASASATGPDASASATGPYANPAQPPSGAHYFPLILQRHQLVTWVTVEPAAGAIVPVGRTRWFEVRITGLPTPITVHALVAFDPRRIVVVDESPEPGVQVGGGDLTEHPDRWRYAWVDNDYGWIVHWSEHAARGQVAGTLFRFRVRGRSPGPSEIRLQVDLFTDGWELPPTEARTRGASLRVVPAREPVLPPTCPETPTREFRSLRVRSKRTDRPAEAHPDLNLALRGYEPGGGFPGLVDLPGHTDLRAPQLGGLLPAVFSPGAPVRFDTVWRVYDWNWPMNTRGPPIRDWQATLVGVDAPAGTTVHVPDSDYDIGEGYEVLVLYAAVDRVTLKYTSEDNVVEGYTLHVEGVCVDPRLRSRYEELRRKGRERLPALKAGQPFGTAFGEVRFAIRDGGSFMDPRSRKDWWRVWRRVVGRPGGVHP